MIPDAFNYRELVQNLTQGRFLAQEWPDGVPFKEGGESFVFYAKDLRLNMREAAIKVAKDQVKESKRLLIRFFRGAAIQAHLHYMRLPGVPDIYEAGEHFYIVEFVKGQKLLDAVKENESAWSLLSQLFRLAHSIHENRIIYRDFKPENLLIDKNGLLWLLDYGLAKQYEDKSSAITKIGERLGSPLFLTEMLQDDAAKATFDDDIQQLGKILWVCLMQRLPETEMEYNSTIAFADPPLTWAKYYLGSQGKRYKTAMAFAQEIERDFKITPCMQSHQQKFTCPVLMQSQEAMNKILSLLSETLE